MLGFMQTKLQYFRVDSDLRGAVLVAMNLAAGPKVDACNVSWVGVNQGLGSMQPNFVLIKFKFVGVW